MKQFEVTLIIEGDDETDTDELKFAMHQLLKFAKRMPPDHRFNWAAVHIEAQAYSF